MVAAVHERRVASPHWILWAFAGLAGCAGAEGETPTAPPPDPPPPDPVVLPAHVEPSNKTVGVGETVQLVAFVPGVPEAFIGPEVVRRGDSWIPASGASWSSSAEAIATVSPTGVVIGVGTGSATITARVGDRSGTARITIGAGRALWAQVAAGGRHNCGLTTEGRAFCWGTGMALGDGSSRTSSVPVAVAGGHTFASISAGERHACGLTSAGEAYCWGWGDRGQLGNGATSEATTPVQVSGGHVFVSIESGWAYNCGLMADGQAYCWGMDESGSLGDGAQVGGAEFDPDQSLPVAVSGGHKFASVRAGIWTTCGVTLDGTLWCWGKGQFGQLGNGFRGADPNTPCGSHCSKSPVRVVTPLTFRSVSVGHFFACGVAQDQMLYCWGGSGVDGTVVLNEWPSTLPEGPWALSFPTLVAPGVRFEHSFSAGQHQCSLTDGGAAHCMFNWVGDGSADSHSLTPVPVAGGETFVRLSSGHYRIDGDPRSHTCGVTGEGRAFCWGVGWVGTGSWAFFSAPLEVPDP